jgi:hypothetical protein
VTREISTRVAEGASPGSLVNEGVHPVTLWVYDRASPTPVHICRYTQTVVGNVPVPFSLISLCRPSVVPELDCHAFPLIGHSEAVPAPDSGPVAAGQLHGRPPPQLALPLSVSIRPDPARIPTFDLPQAPRRTSPMVASASRLFR